MTTYLQNIKTSEVKILQHMEILGNASDWVEITKEQYEELFNEQKEKLNQERITKLKKGYYYPGLKIDNYMENIEEFYHLQPFFYDKNQIFWIWDIKQDKWKILDEVDLMNLLDQNLAFYGQTISRGIKSNYLEAFKRVGRLKQPKDTPKKWIQFKDKAYSLESGKVYTVTPDYFFTNPIDWAIGESEDTPTIDKFIVDWVGEENKAMLLQIISYCLYRYLPIHRIFFLIGSGCNGKTTFLQIILKFLGIENICSTELDNIVGQNAGRFETIKLYKKLACFMGETNFTSMEKTSMLKKLSDNSLIGYEMKGKQPFDEYNYAKLLIASNALPITTDTTDGFWRRCLVIDFPNQFVEGRDIIKEIPNIEFNNLARKCCRILKELLKEGKFSNEGSIEERAKKYIMASNPLPLFIQRKCKLAPDLYNRYGELYNEYLQWLKKHKKRQITKKEFSKLLNEENLEIRKTIKEGQIDLYVEGIKFFLDLPDFSNLPLSSTYSIANREITEIEEIEEKKGIFPQETKVEMENQALETPLTWSNATKVFHKCSIEGCEERECRNDRYGIPYCQNHWEDMSL